MKKLISIQAELKAPKGQFNAFGKYKYRSCEDICEAVKPILTKNGCLLTMTDEIIVVADRIYVKATATIIDAETNEKLSVSAYAREEESKKGMDGSQVTGASSSYARKYALNGLFLIDDTKDSDTTNTGEKVEQKPKEAAKIEVTEDIDLVAALVEIKAAQTTESLQGVWNNYTIYQANKAFILAVKNRKIELTK